MVSRSSKSAHPSQATKLRTVLPPGRYWVSHQRSKAVWDFRQTGINRRPRNSRQDTMSTLAWRRLLLTLCAFAFVQLGVNVWMEELHFGSLPGFAVPFFGPAADADSVQRIPTARAGVEKLIFPATNALAQTGLR